jgi:hypothetical protein
MYLVGVEREYNVETVIDHLGLDMQTHYDYTNIVPTSGFLSIACPLLVKTSRIEYSAITCAWGTTLYLAIVKRRVIAPKILRLLLFRKVLKS